MLWAIVLLVALMIPMLAIILDSPIGRSWARRWARQHVEHNADLTQLGEKVDRLEDELESLARALEATREEVQFLQRLIESGELPQLKPPASPS